MIEDNTFSYYHLDENSTIERFIITPGDSKFQKAFLKAFDFFAKANEAVKGEGAFVFVGYGFNDDHIQRKIVNEILEEKKPGIIITKGLSGNAEELLARSDNLWAVYHISKKYGQVSEDDSLIYNKKFDKSLPIKSKSLRRIQEFSREILGE